MLLILVVIGFIFIIIVAFLYFNVYKKVQRKENLYKRQIEKLKKKQKRRERSETLTQKRD